MVVEPVGRRHHHFGVSSEHQMAAYQISDRAKIWLWYSLAVAGAIFLAAKVVLPLVRRWLMNAEDIIQKALTVRSLDAQQQQGLRLIVEEFAIRGDGDRRKLAYILASVAHESNFRPIKERRGSPGSYAWEMQQKYWDSGYYGRGYIQITWKSNYEKFSKLLGIDLVNNPERALEPPIAARIAVQGMVDGLFTRKKLSDYFNTLKTDWVNARRIVNADVQRNGQAIGNLAQRYYQAIK